MNQRDFYEKISVENTDKECKNNGWTRDDQNKLVFDYISQDIADTYEESAILDVFDIGCGTGMFLDYLQDNGFDSLLIYWGVDFIKSYLDTTASKSDKIPVNLILADLKEDYSLLETVLSFATFTEKIIVISGTFTLFFTKEEAFNIINRLMPYVDVMYISVMNSDYCDSFNPNLLYFSTQEIQDNIVGFQEVEIIPLKEIHHSVIKITQ